MSGTSPVILILGAGPNIGQGVARLFAAKGYKVALASRSQQEADSTPEQLNIKSDFANPDDVVQAFTRTRKELGIPSVVVYNGKSRFPHAPGERVYRAEFEGVAKGVVCSRFPNAVATQ
jgi:NAD(P)-dependent dehydrogenase (short-subunit alcohol dehydrogenase family)